MNYDHDMPPYIQGMADWLEDDSKVHPCCWANAFKGFEIMMAMVRSVAEGGQVAVPLDTGKDEIDLLKAKLSDRKVLLSMSESAKVYGDDK